LTLALILAFSPGEKETPWRVFDFSVDGPANPVARIFKKLARVSPSPWGEGRDEGGRETDYLVVAGCKDWPCAIVAVRKDHSPRGLRQFGLDE
jgi:hypothetical protein